MLLVVAACVLVLAAAWCVLFSLFGIRDPGPYATVFATAGAVFGYLFNASKERNTRSIDLRRGDYTSFVSEWFLANSEVELDELTKARLRLLLFSSKEVVLALKEYVKAEVGNPHAKARQLGSAPQLAELINQMRRDLEQKPLSLDDILWVVQKEGAAEP